MSERCLFCGAEYDSTDDMVFDQDDESWFCNATCMDAQHAFDAEQGGDGVLRRYICRMSADYSLTVEAKSYDEAIEKAANTPAEEWDDRAWSGIDAELQPERNPTDES